MLMPRPSAFAIAQVSTLTEPQLTFCGTCAQMPLKQQAATSAAISFIGKSFKRFLHQHSDTTRRHNSLQWFTKIAHLVIIAGLNYRQPD
jgi:hypothetical protein